MDLDEWDLLSDEGLLDLHHEDGIDSNFFANSVPNAIDMNYFQKNSEPQKNLKFPRVIHVPIQFEYEIPDEITKLPIETTKPDYHKPTEDHQETVSQVFFKKMKENEFVDMKMDSPKSINRGILPQIDVGTYQSGKFEKGIEEQEEITKGDKEEFNDEGFSVWKRAVTGIGALLSFGFAAATVSLIALGNHPKGSAKKQQQHFQFYNHAKRSKQAVHRETRFNEAIAVMRGAPVSRAQITTGGYYEGL